MERGSLSTSGLKWTIAGARRHNRHLANIKEVKSIYKLKYNIMISIGSMPDHFR